MHSRSILGRRLLGKTFGASGSEGMGSAAVLYRDRTTPGSLGNSLRVRLRHSLCFCSKSNNLYALTQHTRDTLLTPQRGGSGIRLGRERHKGRSAPVSTSHRLSAAGHPRPFFVTAFIFNFVKVYHSRRRLSRFLAEKILILYQGALQNFHAGILLPAGKKCYNTEYTMFYARKMPAEKGGRTGCLCR